SKISRVEDAYVSVIAGRDPPPGLNQLYRRAWSAQALGGFWQHVLVAEGVVDVASQPRPRIWDYVAPTLIVDEVGGRATTYDGAPPADDASYVTTNGLVHDEVLRLISGR